MAERKGPWKQILRRLFARDMYLLSAISRRGVQGCRRRALSLRGCSRCRDRDAD